MMDLSIKKFKLWLIKNGAEIIDNENEFEVLKFKSSELGIVYKNGRVNSQYTIKTILNFENKQDWFDKNVLNSVREKSYKLEREILLQRDGCECFYCGKLLLNDITLEHLIPLSSGGKNVLDNMVLCHKKCNYEAGILSLVEKVKIAILNRSKKVKYVKVEYK